MFAFALWDGHDGWLATDRYGEKPLFYATTPDGVALASELPTLARLIGATASLDDATTAAFLSLGYIPGPGTVYQTIKRAPPATIFRISGGQIVESRRYWQPPFGEPGRGPIKPISEKGLDRIQNALTESVGLRLEADAATCLYLSSGVDSSLIAAIAAKSMDRKLDAITVQFPAGTSPDESGDAAKIAAELRLPHEIIENLDDPATVNPDFFFNLMGQPTDDLTLASLYQMAAVGADLGFKVGLTGLGGDEIFFGYGKNSFIFEHRLLLNSPEWLRRALGRLLGSIENVSARSRTYRNVVGVRDFERYLAIKNHPAIGAIRRLKGFESWASQKFAASTQPIEIEIPQFELEGVMTDHRLPSTDAGSMRASMEFRTPFLSRILQETIADFDPRALFRFGQKSVLRRLLKRFLPAELVDLPKRGFIFPADRFHWINSDDAPKPKSLSGNLVDEIWGYRTKPGWKNLATRVVMLSEFETWRPGSFPLLAQNSGVSSKTVNGSR